MSVGIGEIRNVVGSPVKVDDVFDIASLDPDVAEFLRSTGIAAISTLDDKQIAPLVGRACGGLHGGRGGTPDALIMCGPRYPDTLLGSDVCGALHRSGMTSHNVFTLDGLGCAGSSAAWALARDLLAADPAREEIVISYASLPVEGQRLRPPVTAIGDGAFAMTMVRGGRPALLAHRAEIDGQYADLFRADYKSAGPERWKEVCTSPDTYRFTFAIQSRKVLNRLIDGVLADAGLSRSDVATTLMQNITLAAFDFYQSSLNLPIDPVCGVNLRDHGHLGAMDVVLNMATLLDSKRLSGGDVVLVVNASPVAMWAVSLFQV